MGELIVTTFMTLDGVLQAPGGPDEDRESGFEHGGWQAPFFDPESGERMLQEYGSWDAYLLGRKTYDIFASFWPKAEDSPFTRLMNSLPRYVASHTLTQADWAGTTILSGDLAEEVARIKERHEQIGLWGSGDLAQSLLREELVDRLYLWLYPVVLGSGKRLFGDGAVSAAWRRVDAATFDGGAVMLSYERTGKPTYGDMGEGSS
jgi:dihydrofolate reductase